MVAARREDGEPARPPCSVSSSGTSRDSTSTSPGLVGTSSMLSTVGRRRSAEMSSTRRPLCSSVTARLAATVDLPSPATALVTAMTFASASSAAIVTDGAEPAERVGLGRLGRVHRDQ